MVVYSVHIWSKNPQCLILVELIQKTFNIVVTQYDTQSPCNIYVTHVKVFSVNKIDSFLYMKYEKAA